MNREEFLQELRRSLDGLVPTAIIEENIRYYAAYISGETAKGRTEEEVLAEIGDPRLIAKTIADTTPGTEDYIETEDGNGDYREYREEEDTSGREQNPYGRVHTITFDKWYSKYLLIAGIFLILYLILQIIGGIFLFFLPILRPLLIIWLLWTGFKLMFRR